MKFLRKIRKDLPYLFFILLFTLPVFVRLIRPGYFVMQDDLQAFRTQQMDKCFEDKQLPCRWVPDAGYQYGYPQFNYYPPSVYYFGALLHRVGFQYIDAVKAMFVLGYIVSAITMYLLASSVFKNRWIGFISSLLYTYIPYKAVEVYVRGALNEFWALSFFPLVLWASYRLIKKDKKKYLLWLSIAIALLLTTHSLTAMIFIPFAAVWVFFWIFRFKKEVFNKKLIVSLLLGFGLSAFFVLPMMLEKQYVHVDSVLSGYFDYRQHFVSLYKLFISREWGYGSSGFPNELLNLSVGVVQWGAGILAVIVSILNFKKKNKSYAYLGITLGLMTIFSLFMIHMKSSFIWMMLPFLKWLQFPWRFLSISIVLLPVLVGVLLHYTGKAKYIIGSLLVVGAILLNIQFFKEKEWLNITDQEKFSGQYWEKQLTISIFDYLPIYATLPPVEKAPAEPEVLEGVAKFEYYEKGSNWQKGKVKVETEKALLRAPIYDFPGMTVSSSENIVKHTNDDCRGQEFCLGLVTFELDNGDHDIKIELKDTPIRTIGNYLSIFSVLYLIFLILKRNDDFN